MSADVAAGRHSLSPLSTSKPPFPRHCWSDVLSYNGVSPSHLIVCLLSVLRVIILSYRACIEPGPLVSRTVTRLGQMGRETRPCAHHRGPRDQEACEGMTRFFI